MACGCTSTPPTPEVLSYVRNFVDGFTESNSPIRSRSIRASGSWSILTAQPCGESNITIFNLLKIKMFYVCIFIFTLRKIVS